MRTDIIFCRCKLNLSATGAPFLFCRGDMLSNGGRKEKTDMETKRINAAAATSMFLFFFPRHTHRERREQQDDAIQEGVVDADLDAYVQGPVVLVPSVYSPACKQKGGAPCKFRHARDRIKRR
jgi:hypothetical protein